MNLKMKRIHRLVVKIGSSLLTRAGGRLDERRVAHFAHALSAIHQSGVEVVIVTSGAIAAGVGELGWGKRPTLLPKKQAAAAVGQVCLMERYRNYFAAEKITVGQVLLTREDFEDRQRYHNARATLLALLEAKVIPIINENDSVGVEEIRLGDNDTLAARVAIKVRADMLVLLTDVEGLMTQHPRRGQGRLIRRVDTIGSRIDGLAHAAAGSERGTGGMATKIRAARQVTSHGIPMIIANGRAPDVLQKIIQGRAVGTLFVPKVN